MPKVAIYREQLLTLEDLTSFKRELLSAIRLMFKEHNGQQQKRWLKSNEVRKLLQISPGTLQHLRMNGTIPFTRMGGVIYHDKEDIEKVLQEHKLQSRQENEHV